MSTVLVVDDNVPVLDLMERVLALEDYRVIRATDGSQALEVLRGQEVHLVITDIDMPVMDGVEFLARLRSEGFSVPVLAMSGDYDPDLAVQKGFEAFIRKPFQIGAVLELAARMVAKGVAKQRKILIVDDMQEMRAVVRTMVEQLGFRGLEAGNGAEALEILQSKGADLVVTDCAMPVMNGRDFLAEVKKRFPTLPIIVTSANFKPKDVDALKPFGFLPKPYPLDSLRKIVLSALS